MGLFNKQKDVKTAPNTSCPHCKMIFDTIPKRKTKCPSCGNDVYVRTDPFSKQKVLLNLDDAFSLDKLKDLDVSQKEYQNIEKELSKKFKTAPSRGDIVWAIFNEKLLSAMKKSNWQEMKMLYFLQARLLYERGKEYFKLLQEAARCELQNYQSSGVCKKVEILTAGDQSCEKCNILSGKVFTIEKALETMPIPVKDCGNDGWCRCMYIPLT